MNRYDKIEWLKESCSHDFFENHLMNEMVRWMGEDDFGKFYDHLCGCWGIAKSPEELEEMLAD